MPDDKPDPSPATPATPYRAANPVVVVPRKALGRGGSFAVGVVTPVVLFAAHNQWPHYYLWGHPIGASILFGVIGAAAIGICRMRPSVRWVLAGFLSTVVPVGLWFLWMLMHLRL